MEKSLNKAKATEAFDNFSTNLDVLRKLYDLLEPGDQLRLALVTPQQRFVLRHYIWCRNYKRLKIRKVFDTIRLLDEQNHMDCEFSGEEFSYFLDIFGANVIELSESHGTALPIFSYIPNLVSIEYNSLLLTKKHLSLLAATCKKLEKLCISYCCNKNRKIICLGPDIELETLVLMENLKSFTLKSNFHSKEIKYRLKNDFFKKIKWTMEISRSLESLNIYLYSLSKNLFKFFPNLQNLTLYIVDSIRSEELKALDSACPQLKQLTFNYCTFDVQTYFSNFKSLKNLTLYHCTGLTYDNLKEILTEFKNLITFTSIATKYAGNMFHYYFVTPSIKSIYIDSIRSYDFQSGI